MPNSLRIFALEITVILIVVAVFMLGLVQEISWYALVGFLSGATVLLITILSYFNTTSALVYPIVVHQSASGNYFQRILESPQRFSVPSLLLRIRNTGPGVGYDISIKVEPMVNDKALRDPVGNDLTEKIIKRSFPALGPRDSLDIIELSLGKGNEPGFKITICSVSGLLRRRHDSSFYTYDREGFLQHYEVISTCGCGKAL